MISLQQNPQHTLFEIEFWYLTSFLSAPGVVHTHGSISAQISALTNAWEWRPSDRLLHALPLHHIHGIVVGLYSAHASGAVVEFLPRFSPTAVWERLMVRTDTGFRIRPLGEHCLGFRV